MEANCSYGSGCENHKIKRGRRFSFKIEKNLKSNQLIYDSADCKSEYRSKDKIKKFSKIYSGGPLSQYKTSCGFEIKEKAAITIQSFFRMRLVKNHIKS